MTNNMHLRPRHMIAGSVLALSAAIGFVGSAALDSVAQATEPLPEPTSITLPTPTADPTVEVTPEPLPEPTLVPTEEPEPIEEPEIEEPAEEEPESDDEEITDPPPSDNKMQGLPDLETLDALETCHAAAWAGYDAMVMDDQDMMEYFEAMLDLCDEVSGLEAPEVNWDPTTEDWEIDTATDE